MKTIAFGCDHAGFVQRQTVIDHLESLGFDLIDFGTFSEDSVDYPDFAHKVANAVTNGDADWGVLICGSGQGMAIAANKHQLIRAALCWNIEVASLARSHNNANVLCLPGRMLGQVETIQILNQFIESTFEGGRHQSRIDKIPC